MSKRISPSDHNVLIICYFDTVDQNLINIEISLDEVKYENEKAFRYDLNESLQSILAEIERQKIRNTIKHSLRR